MCNEDVIRNGTTDLEKQRSTAKSRNIQGFSSFRMLKLYSSMPYSFVIILLRILE